MPSIKPYALYFENDRIVLLVRKSQDLLDSVKTNLGDVHNEIMDDFSIVLAKGDFSEIRKRKRMFYMPNELYVSNNVIVVTHGGEVSYCLKISDENTSKLDAIVRALAGEQFVMDSKYYLTLCRVKINSHEDTVLGGLFVA